MIKRSKPSLTKALLSLTILLVLFPLVHADSGVIDKPGLIVTPAPLSNETSSILAVTGPAIEYHKKDQDFMFIVQTFNRTNSVLLANNSDMFCTINLYRPLNGTVILTNNMTLSSNKMNWYFNAKGGNFSEIGEYVALFYCQHSGGSDYHGGFAGYSFEVTNKGTEFTVSESLTYFILVLGVFLLFSLSFYFMLSVPYSNAVNKKGAVIKIIKLKYVKLGLILLSWVLLTWLLNILVGISDNFASLPMYYGFFGFIFNLMNKLAWPVGIIIFVIALFEIVRDSNIQKRINKFGSSQK